MLLKYDQMSLYLWQPSHRLGAVQRDLDTLKREGLLAGDIKALRDLGYEKCRGLADDETLVSLAASTVSQALIGLSQPRALISQHCRAECAALPPDPADTIGATRNRYFPAAVLRELELDHVPYFCSFASGCAGFISVLGLAAGVFLSPEPGSVVCLMADACPPGVPFNMVRERILGSDYTSAFIVGREPRGYQLLGINFYSTPRSLGPLVEIVKRTVQMTQELATCVGVNLTESDVAIHFPNIFPDTWKMVARYLRLSRGETIIDEMAERAHCGATDSVITLTKQHRGCAGRVHVVVNYGVGLHLGVALLREHENSLRS